jgi:ribosomal protein S18 acetylase RimI-like enzyme
MTDCSGGDGGYPGRDAASATVRDAKMLEDTMREAIRTSPDSFLTPLVHVASKKANDWIHEIQSSTWVVAERDGKSVGIASCKPPEQGKDQESGHDSRYIESAWIDPDLRGRRLGERLIRYLMAAEFRKNPDIERFLLWVFERNRSCISLYERMGFLQTGDRHDGFRAEIKYRLDVTPGISTDSWQAADEVLLGDDKERCRITYRVLGEGDSA